MRLGMASLLAVGALSFAADGAVGQPLADRASARSPSGDTGAFSLQSRTGAPPDILPRHPRCLLNSAERAAATNLANLLVARIRVALKTSESRPLDAREAFVESAILRTVEYSNECPAITLWAIALARDMTALGSPLNGAFDLALAAVDPGPRRDPCDCGLGARGRAPFGGPPFGGSGGGAAGVTHPSVADPQ